MGKLGVVHRSQGNQGPDQPTASAASEEGFNYRSTGMGGPLVQRLFIDLALMMKAYKRHFLLESSYLPRSDNITQQCKNVAHAPPGIASFPWQHA